MAKKRIKNIICPNCDYILRSADNYCPNCGQENHTFKLPIKHFIMEVIEGYFHFDTKILRTFQDMVLKPGLITKNYNLGKRARYVPPIKFYIFVSFIFFVILSFQRTDINVADSNTDSTGLKISINSFNEVANPADLKRLAAYPELTTKVIDHYLDSIGIKTTWYNHSIYQNVVKSYTGHLTQEEFQHKIRKTLSYLMFLLMPLIAFYLYILHKRSKKYYSEHLIFSIHLHSLAFMVLIFWLLIKSYLSSEWFLIFVIPGLFLYTIFALKTVYQQKIGVVIYKTVLLTLLYFISLVFFFATTIILSLL
jgi:hypothetical protein